MMVYMKFRGFVRLINNMMHTTSVANSSWPIVPGISHWCLSPSTTARARCMLGMGDFVGFAVVAWGAPK